MLDDHKEGQYIKVNNKEATVKKNKEKLRQNLLFRSEQLCKKLTSIIFANDF